MRGPRPTSCTFPASFLQEARSTVRRRTAAIQTVQRFRLALLLHEDPTLSHAIAAQQVARFHEEWRAGRTVGSALRRAQNWLRHDIPNGRYLKEKLLQPLLSEFRGPTHEKIREQADHFAARYPDSPPFASEVHWVAFIASGLTYPL